jgi:hypothetical protein
MLDYLRPVYFTRQDTKDAGFIETDHYGVRFTNRSSHIDLTEVSQRWLRDLLWNWLDTRLTANPPRSRTPFEAGRRGCNELSAYLQAQAPGGGHDPTALAAAHMNAFVADQRRRAEHGLPALAIRPQGGRAGGDGELTTVTKPRMAVVFNGARRVLRAAWSPAPPSASAWTAPSSSPCPTAAVTVDAAARFPTPSPRLSRTRPTWSSWTASTQTTAACATSGKR